MDRDDLILMTEPAREKVWHSLQNFYRCSTCPTCVLQRSSRRADRRQRIDLVALRSKFERVVTKSVQAVYRYPSSPGVRSHLYGEITGFSNADKQPRPFSSCIDTTAAFEKCWKYEQRTQARFWTPGNHGS